MKNIFLSLMVEKYEMAVKDFKRIVEIQRLEERVTKLIEERNEALGYIRRIERCVDVPRELSYDRKHSK